MTLNKNSKTGRRIDLVGWFYRLKAAANFRLSPRGVRAIKISGRESAIFIIANV